MCKHDDAGERVLRKFGQTARITTARDSADAVFHYAFTLAEIAAIQAALSATEVCCDCGGRGRASAPDTGAVPCIGCDGTGRQPKGSSLLEAELCAADAAPVSGDARALIAALKSFIVRGHHIDKCRNRTGETCDCGKHTLLNRVYAFEQGLG